MVQNRQRLNNWMKNDSFWYFGKKWNWGKFLGIDALLLRHFDSKTAADWKIHHRRTKHTKDCRDFWMLNFGRFISISFAVDKWPWNTICSKDYQLICNTHKFALLVVRQIAIVNTSSKTLQEIFAVEFKSIHYRLFLARSLLFNSNYWDHWNRTMVHGL